MSRVQLALNVKDIDEAVGFYAKLFGTGPAKRRPGYANFAIAEPPLKLVLLENPGHGGTLNHLGVEVADAGAVDAEQARLAEAGLAAVDERDTTCCYARQDKFWVVGAPGGERWEIYAVLQDSPTFWGQDGAQSWEASRPRWTRRPAHPLPRRQRGAAADSRRPAGPGTRPPAPAAPDRASARGRLNGYRVTAYQPAWPLALRDERHGAGSSWRG